MADEPDAGIAPQREWLTKTRKASETLTPQLKRIACDALDAYLSAPTGPDGRTPVELEMEGDRKRADLIDSTLKPLVSAYFDGSVPLAAFKTQVDGINKRNQLWGFKGVKGQMFFNMLTNAAEDDDEFDTELKAVLHVPHSEEQAVAQLTPFRSFVIRTGERFVGVKGKLHSRPQPGSIPFFVSYFWQIQQRDVWPVYYTTTVQSMADLNLWQETGEIDADYLSYKRFHEALVAVFSEAAGRPFTFYDVEHVFWFKSGRVIGGVPKTGDIASAEGDTAALIKPALNSSVVTNGAVTLPDSYVPPIVAVIPRLAVHEPEIRDAARRAGTSIERALEKSCNAAFTVLGYETKLLGQGMGRLPDGQAVAQDESYGILWDAKVRTDGYSMGTDDRTIREYISTQSRDLKRRRGLRNIYYVIISSSFTDEFDDLIRSLKMETNKSPGIV